MHNSIIESGSGEYQDIHSSILEFLPLPQGPPGYYIMRMSALFLVLLPLFVLYGSYAVAQTNNISQIIIANAEADDIDLSVLDFLDDALKEIEDLSNTTSTRRRCSHVGRDPWRRSAVPGPIIDVHAHTVPTWYRLIVPVTGGSPTPEWDIDTFFSFMESEGIDHAVLSFSTPGANVFPGSEALTVALARLMNEQAAAYCRVSPTHLNFFATVPLPYTSAAIAEATYAIDRLGAIGVALMSNFEGLYLGDPQLKPFFEAMNKRNGKQFFFIHPSAPYLKSNGKLIDANPTRYPSGIVEFYFETARTVMDLTVTMTIHNFTNINYIIPHASGAFAAIIDRFLKTEPAIYNSSMEIYDTRFLYDTAGPTGYHQLAGLLGYDIPASQLCFGTDYPYAPQFTQAGSLAAVISNTLLTASEKAALFSTNVKAFFGTGINFT